MKFQRPAVLPILLAALVAAESSLGLADDPGRSPLPITMAEQPRNLRQALDAVGSIRFVQRDAASSYLLRQSASVLPEVEASLAKESDPEVITRLTSVAVHLYMKSLTTFTGRFAMLGIALRMDAIQFGPDDYHAAIAVAELQPGFPAAELLKVGDRITGINGETFSSDYTVDEFRGKVSRQSPGTVLRFTVLRGNEKLQIPVALAAVTDADDPGTFIANRNVSIENYLAGLKTGSVPGVVLPGALPADPDYTRGYRLQNRLLVVPAE